MKKLLLFFVFFVGISINSRATITTATSSGDWADAIWDNGVPGCFDTIVIPATSIVTITATVTLIGACPDSMLLIVEGQLVFQNGKKLKLPCLSDVYVTASGSIGVGSGGGNSTYIEMCNTQYWNANSGDLTGPTTLCDGGCSTLPIELLTFAATLNENLRVADLYWITKSETNNDFFTIERSSNGTEWSPILNVNGAGNSSLELHYRDVDSKPLMGLSYYRLRQTDFDGHYSYSPAVSVEMYAKNDLLIYPNPAEGGSSVAIKYIVVSFPEEFKGESELIVCSVEGKIVYQTQINVTESKQIFIQLDERFAAGFYTVETSFANAKFLVK